MARILIHCIHYPVCSGRYAVDAFKRLGHEVCHVGQETGRHIWGMEVPAEYAWSQEEPPDGWHPDLAILMDTAYEWHHENAPTVVWSVDNHVRDSLQEGIAHYFLAHKSVSVMPWERREPVTLGGKPYGLHIDEPQPDMTWLPCATDLHAFPPSPIPWAERSYDVCMIGVMYERRWQLVQAMRAAGLKVLAGTGLVYDAYKEAYWNSRVALVSSFNGDLPIRLFEGAGMGCVPLCDPIEDLRNLDNSPAMVFTSVEDAVNKAKLVARFPVPEGLGEAGAESCTRWAQQHTWEARCKVVIDWLEGRK